MPWGSALAFPCTAPIALEPIRCSISSCSAGPRGNQIIEDLKKNPHHKQLPADAADKALARVWPAWTARKNGESVAQVGDDLRKTMQAHCGVFRFADMLRQGVEKIDEVAEARRAH